MGSPLSYAAAAASNTLEEQLTRMFLQQLEKQKLAQQANRDSTVAELGRGNLDVSRGNLELRGKEFDASQQPKAPDPLRPMSVGGRIVDPNTGKVIYEPPATPTPQRPVSVAPGGKLVDPTSGKVIFAAPDRPQAAGSGGEFTSVQQVVGPDGNPALAIVDRRSGKATPVQMPQGYEPNRPARPVTGAERQTLAYYLRMEQALKDIEALEPEISKQGLLGQAQGQYAPNILQNETQQRYRQAQRAFTEGRLRKESGAAIPAGEYENDARTYFFQPGDKDLTQKSAGRRQVLEGLKMSSGRAYQEHFGADDKKKKDGGDDAAAKAAALIKKYGGG